MNNEIDVYPNLILRGIPEIAVKNDKQSWTVVKVLNRFPVSSKTISNHVKLL